MEDRWKRERGFSREEALSLVYQANREAKAANKDETSPRERKTGPKRYRGLSEVFKGTERQDGRCG